MNKREEISDVIPDKLWEHPDFKAGYVLRFDEATLKITKINRRAKRVWAEHVQLVERIVANTHDNHHIDLTGSPPYCLDCKVYVDEPATAEGKAKLEKRQEGMLSDGTKIS